MAIEDTGPKPALPKSLQRKSASPSPQSDAASRFIASMIMDYEKWHDGTGYDLTALSAIPAQEREHIADILIQHKPRDWRDIEALAQIDLPSARQTVINALNDSDPKVRREAMNHAPEHIDDKKREKLLIEAIASANLYSGLTEALDEAEQFHPPMVIDALFRAALTRDGEAAVHFAALLFYLCGKSKEAFDWAHRPFFLRFHDTDSALRKAAFLELCQTLGVDPQKYLPG